MVRRSDSLLFGVLTVASLALTGLYAGFSARADGDESRYSWNDMRSKIDVRIKGEIESLAGGRVYTGLEAVEIGLVDRLGGFAAAIKHAASEAELGTDYELRVFPRPKSLFDILSEAFGGDGDQDEFVFLARSVKNSLAGSKYARLPTIAAALEALQTVDPEKAQALEYFLVHLQLLSEENVLLVGPDFTMMLR